MAKKKVYTFTLSKEAKRLLKVAQAGRDIPVRIEADNNVFVNLAKAGDRELELLYRNGKGALVTRRELKADQPAEG